MPYLFVSDKETVKPECVVRKKVPFRDIHKTYGRKILADRSEWRAKLRLRDEAPLIQL